MIETVSGRKADISLLTIMSGKSNFAIRLLATAIPSIISIPRPTATSGNTGSPEYINKETTSSALKLRSVPDSLFWNLLNLPKASSATSEDPCLIDPLSDRIPSIPLTNAGPKNHPTITAATTDMVKNNLAKQPPKQPTF